MIVWVAPEIFVLGAFDFRARRGDGSSHVACPASLVRVRVFCPTFVSLRNRRLMTVYAE